MKTPRQFPNQQGKSDFLQLPHLFYLELVHITVSVQIHLFSKHIHLNQQVSDGGCFFQTGNHSFFRCFFCQAVQVFRTGPAADDLDSVKLLSSQFFDLLCSFGIVVCQAVIDDAGQFTYCLRNRLSAFPAAAVICSVTSTVTTGGVFPVAAVNSAA